LDATSLQAASRSSRFFGQMKAYFEAVERMISMNLQTIASTSAGSCSLLISNTADVDRITVILEVPADEKQVRQKIKAIGIEMGGHQVALAFVAVVDRLSRGLANGVDQHIAAVGGSALIVSDITVPVLGRW
jgi:hypothetical protein